MKVEWCEHYDMTGDNGVPVIRNKDNLPYSLPKETTCCPICGAKRPK